MPVWWRLTLMCEFIYGKLKTVSNIQYTKLLLGNSSVSGTIGLFIRAGCPCMHCTDTIRKIRNKYFQKGSAQLQSLFPYWCVCEWFICSHERFAYSAAWKYVDWFWENINRSQTHECGIEAAQFLFWEYIYGIFVAVCDPAPRLTEFVCLTVGCSRRKIRLIESNAKCR